MIAALKTAIRRSHDLARWRPAAARRRGDWVLSIVVTTFNRREPLRKLLDHFRDQTDPEFEVVVAIDGSTDGTQMMLDEYVKGAPFEVRWIDTGQTDRYCLGMARNMGILETRGKAVVILDDDSFPTGDFVEQHKRTVKPHTLTGGYRTSHDPEDELHPKMKELLRGRVRLERAVENNCCMLRQDWVGCGMFSERIDGYGGIGQEFTARLARQGFRYRFNPSAVIFHHRELEGDNGLTRAQKLEQHAQNLALLREKFWPERGETR